MLWNGQMHFKAFFYLCKKHWILNYVFTVVTIAVTWVCATETGCCTEMLLRQNLEFQGIFFLSFFFFS